MTKFEGILPAVVTPFDLEGNFNAAAFERLLERVYGAGVDGLYVNGQTGEGLQQTVEQRKESAEAAVRMSPKGKTVIVHVGAHRTVDAIALARHAAKVGVSAISSLPPQGMYSFEEIYAYYEAVAAATDVPLLVYYFPAASPAVKEAEQALRLLEIKNVIGLKFTDYDLYKLWLLKRRGCVVFNGHDEVLVAGMLMGADGGIGSFYNVAPELFVRAYGLAQAGEWEEARAVQERINELVEIGLRFPVVPAIKKMLEWSGVDCGRCVAPRRGLTEKEEGALKEALRGAGFEGLAG